MKKLGKRIFTFLLITGFLSITSVFGQQAPQFTQYRNAQMFSNAGFAGMGPGICVNGIVRQQWSGFKDIDGNMVAPQTFLVSIDSPIKILHGGAGLSIVQDKLGFEDNTIVQLAYSFHLELSSGVLGIGAGLNLTNRNIDFSQFKPVVDGDPVLLSAKQGDMLIDANLGFFYRGDNDLYFGLGAKNLFESHGKNFSTSDRVIQYNTDRTLYLTAGYQFQMPGQPDFEIHPSLLIQSDFASTQYNLSAVVNYKNKFWGGVNYRFQESVGLIVGVRFRDFQVAYSYDVNTMFLGVPGSHEVSLNYCFKIKADKTKTSYKNTRFL